MLGKTEIFELIAAFVIGYAIIFLAMWIFSRRKIEKKK
jgi:hypothetical protein